MNPHLIGELHEQFVEAGLLIYGLSLQAEDKLPVTIHWQKQPNPDDVAKAQSICDAFDWAQATKSELRQRLLDALVDEFASKHPQITGKPMSNA